MRKSTFSHSAATLAVTLVTLIAIGTQSAITHPPSAIEPQQSAIGKHQSAIISPPCAGAQPITRWNRLTATQRANLADDNLLTNVTGFPTGFQNALLMPIFMDINSASAANTGSGDVNVSSVHRWGFTSFNNGRNDDAYSGNQFCFTFSEAIPVELSSEEHSHFQNNEHIRVTAFDAANLPLALSGSLQGTVGGGALLTGNGTPALHFDAQNKRAAGMWWTASSDGAAVKTLCVEYYRSSPAEDIFGREPFSLSVCGATRYLFDDPFAMSVAPPATPAVNDNLSFQKTLTCVRQAASGVAGNVDATFRLAVKNEGTGAVEGIQIEEDLEDAFPGSSLIGLVGSLAFLPGSNPNLFPALNAAFDGKNVIQLFQTGTGRLLPGQQIILEMVLETDPSKLFRYENAVNQGFAFAHDPLTLTAVSAASDAPAGTPGDTGAANDPTMLWIPANNLTINAVSAQQGCSVVAGDVQFNFEYVLENTGNTDLDRFELLNDLASAMGSVFKNTSNPPVVVTSSATSTPVPVGIFDGVSNIQILNGLNGKMRPGELTKLRLTLKADPNSAGAPSPVENAAQLTARGIFPDGTPLPGCDGGLLLAYDESDGGNDPHSQNTGFPGNTGGSDDLLLLNLPSLQVATHLAGVDYANSEASNTFDAIFEVILKNTGNVPLTNLSLNNPMSQATAFGTAFQSIVELPHFVATGAHGALNNPTILPALNAAWNGSGDLLFGGGLLAPGQTLVLQFRAQLKPSAAGAPAIPKYQVTASANGTGLTGTAATVSDASDSGFLPENTNPGRPGDTGTHCDPTPLGNCWDLLSNGIACNNLVQISMDENCVANIFPEMVLEGEFMACTGDNLFPLGGYYDIIVLTPGMEMLTDGDPSTPNVFEVPGSYVGQTLTVKIKDVVHENSCWGMVKLEDKLDPKFTCTGTPVVISCSTSLASVPPPAVSDNCDGTPTVTLIGSQIVNNNFCDDGLYIIRRTYSATDIYGNVSDPCVQEIHFNRPPIDFPDDVMWHCSQYNDHPGITNPTALNPLVTDSDLLAIGINASLSLSAATLNSTGSGVIGNTGGLCNFVVNYSDDTVDVCGNGFKILRTWVVLDWCLPGVINSSNGEDNIQIIKVEDKTAPTITRPPFSVSANVAATIPDPCRSTGLLLPPIVEDECSEYFVQIITPLGEAIYVGGNPLNGGFIPNPGLPKGVHNITYVVTDSCFNTSTLIVPVTVVDDLPPTPVCEGPTQVVLDAGTASAFALSFDDGSNDNCCIHHFEARRMSETCNDGLDDTVFGTSVTFCCSDVSATPVMVVLRVFDCNGNHNDCMVEVLVTDNGAPTVAACPTPEIRITCDVYVAALETQLNALNGNPAAQSQLLDTQFGTATFADNCGNPSINRSFFRFIDATCKEGFMTRMWSATDAGGASSPVCSQTILVDHVSDWAITFPEDRTVTCGTSVPDFGEPTVFNSTCDLVAVSHLDVTSYITPGACFEIQRTWTAINWCVIGDFSDQEVAEQSEMDLGLPYPACDLDGDGDCDDRTFRDSWRSGAIAENVRPTAASATRNTVPDTDPDSDPWDGFITYVQTIKVIDNVQPTFPANCALPDILITGTTCSATFTLPSPAIDDCSTNVSISATGALGAGFGPFTASPGLYPVTFTANDNCGNSATCSTNLRVRDAKAPTAYCISGLVVTLSNSDPAVATVAAASLNNASTDNCPGTLGFSFDQSDDVDNVTFGCAEQGVNMIQMWISDASGNLSSCIVTIIVQVTGPQCGDDDLFVDLSGGIANEDGEPIGNVNVLLSGQSNGTEISDGDGGYQFGDLSPGNDLTLTPLRDDEPLFGVTTFDLVLMTKHILNIELLDSPYKLIAADVNKSGSVTTFDLVELRKLILFIQEDFPNNTSWRFVDKDYVFPNPANPWQEQFPEIINFNNLSTDELAADFIAVKIGDINNSSGNLHGSGTDERSGGRLTFFAEEKTLLAGEIFTLDFRVEDVEVLGYQFTLEFDPTSVEVLNVSGFEQGGGNFGRSKEKEGYVTVSWHDGEARLLPKEETLFSLQLKALKAGKVNDWLTLGSRYTQAEAYSSAGDLMDVALRFVPPVLVADEVELYQNTPNPFRESTVVGFRLPEAIHARLTFTDLSGKVLKTVEGDFEQGYHEVSLRREDLPASGVIYYRLEAGGKEVLRRAVKL